MTSVELLSNTREIISSKVEGYHSFQIDQTKIYVSANLLSKFLVVTLSVQSFYSTAFSSYHSFHFIGQENNFFRPLCMFWTPGFYSREANIFNYDSWEFSNTITD